MTLNVLKSAEKGSALTQAEHDANWTAVENEVNAKPDASAVATAAQGAKADSAAQLNVVQTWTSAQREAITTLVDGAAITVDLSASNLFSLTLGGDRILSNPSNIGVGQSGSIFITQDSTGGRNLTFGTYWQFENGPYPSLSVSSGAVDRLDYVVRTPTSIHCTLHKEFVSVFPLLTPATDSRTVNVIDGDRSPSTHSQWMGIQRYTGETIDQITDLNPTEVAYHADGTTPWIGRVGSEYVTRLKQGQTTFASNTTRAEYYGPNTTPAPTSEAIDENYGNAYWFAVDFRVGSDITSNTGVQSWTGPNVLQIGGTHNITWPGFTNSAGRDMAFFLNGGMLQFIITPPGSGPGLVYDVRSTPLSTTIVDTTTGGGDSGNERIWRLLDLVADQQTKIIIKVKYDNGDNALANPRTEVWTKQGNGSLIKRIDHYGPNTFSNGLRYWKIGLYSFSGENTSPWWGDKNTRTINWRSNLVMRGAAGASFAEPTLDENVILAWLER